MHDAPVTVDQLPLDAELASVTLPARRGDPNLSRRDRHATEQPLAGRLVAGRRSHPEQGEQCAEHGEGRAERLASPPALVDRRGGIARHGRTRGLFMSHT
jgi:hypothetical protein